MSRLPPALLTALALAWPVAAQDSDLFQQFLQLCAGPTAVSNAAMAAADAAGWAATPAPILAMVQRDGFEVSDSRMKSTASGLMLLATGEGRQGKAAIRARTCLVTSNVVDAAALKAQAQAWAAVAPDIALSVDGTTAWQFVEKWDGSHSGGLMTQTEAMRAMQRGEIRIVAVRALPQGGVLLSYSVPRLAARG